ncbi:MAG: hypothetical protein KDA78_04840 [Planctomycetaceae bacterium]|nr:hypothetical protein [Planctomycetaceae bacterium]
MSSTTLSLKALHQILQNLEQAREKIEKGPRQIQIREGIVKKREQELADFLEALKRRKMNSDSKSLELKTVEKKLQDLQAKLNSASSNREFDAFKEQIRADEMAKSVLEDEILESFDLMEAEAAKRPNFEKSLENARQELKSFQAQFQEDEVRCKATIEQLSTELVDMEKMLPSEPREQYKRLVKSRGAKAMGPISNGACGNCFVNLTPQQRILIKTGPIQFCSSCATMLYIDEEADN